MNRALIFMPSADDHLSASSQTPSKIPCLQSLHICVETLMGLTQTVCTLVPPENFLKSVNPRPFTELPVIGPRLSTFVEVLANGGRGYAQPWRYELAARGATIDRRCYDPATPRD